MCANEFSSPYCGEDRRLYVYSLLSDEMLHCFFVSPQAIPCGRILIKFE